MCEKGPEMCEKGPEMCLYKTALIFIMDCFMFQFLIC